MKTLKELEQDLSDWKAECKQDHRNFYLPTSIDALVELLESAIALVNMHWSIGRLDCPVCKTGREFEGVNYCINCGKALSK